MPKCILERRIYKKAENIHIESSINILSKGTGAAKCTQQIIL
jgi:hypothetical protein